MPYSEKDIREILKNWVNSYEGHETLRKEGVNVQREFSVEKSRQIANTLKEDIINAFLSLVEDTYAVFRKELVTVSVKSVGTGDGKRIKATIRFDDKALRRPSLGKVGDGGSPENNSLTFGVYDIIGLFTQGYSANPAYGIWYRDDGSTPYKRHGYDDYGSGIIKSRTFRIGNAFVNHIINNYQMMYPEIQFSWPKLWGGNK